MKLRPYQIDAINGARRAFVGDKTNGIPPVRAAIDTLPTGTGKSLIFLAVAQGVVERGRRVLLLVEGIKLVQQAAKHFRKAGLTVGIEMGELTALPWADLTTKQRELMEAMPYAGEGLFVKGPQVISASCLVELGLARKIKNAQSSAGGWYLRLDPELPQVVVASVDSIVNRLERYPADFFRMIVVDEAHHAVAPSYISVFKHFGVSVPLNDPKDIKDLVKSPWVGDVLLFGLTATPDRGDKRDLMRLFETVGFEYDIRTAISDGWLVPIRNEFCHLEGLDLRKVRKSSGDLDPVQLCELLEPLMEPICDAIVRVSDGRPTLCYSPLVNLAETATMRLRMAAPDRVIETITGETESKGCKRCETMPTEVEWCRECLFAGIDTGKVWALSSVGTLTEGVDLPRAAVAGMLRLTMSRLLYAQILGRVLRPAPEIADALNDCASAEERRAMIAASSKPFATILDFAGNCGKHRLVRSLDILADPDDPALSMAEAEMERGEVDPMVALDRARAALQAMLEAARGKDIQRILVDPFELLSVEKKTDAWGRAAIDRQIHALLESGIIDFRTRFPKITDPGEHAKAVQAARAEAEAKLRKMFDMTSASAMIAERSRRIDADQCNPKQMRILIKAGLPAADVRAMSFKTASAALDQLAAASWKSSPAWIERWSAARREAA
jgi:superfamily II DNA or RNA helicase